MEVLIFFYKYAQQGRVSKRWQISTKKAVFLNKKSTLTILLASVGLSSPHFLFFFAFTLNLNKHGCNAGEEEEPCFVFRITHVFVHACEACRGHPSNVFAMRVGEGCNVEFGV